MAVLRSCRSRVTGGLCRDAAHAGGAAGADQQDGPQRCARHRARKAAVGHAHPWVEAESTLRIVQEIEIESQKLADVDVDVIVFPATAPSSRNGIGYDQELIKRISAASGKPATT